MRNLLLAGVAAATFATTVSAQETCEQRRDNRTVGTVAGAGIGAVLGGAIGGNALGAVLGAVGGGVAGNQLTRGPEDCQHAYGYYDNRSQWHANRVDPAAATGYYDRDGRWVVGAPAGSYDRDGRWVQGDASRGYRDRNGYWVPANAAGYYAVDGSYVNAQPVEARPAYADNRGYSNDQRGDNRGYGSDQRADDRGYGNDRYYGVDQHDVRGRIDRTAQRIDRAVSDGSLDPDQARRARYDLARVSRLQAGMQRYRGQLSPTNFATIDSRLDEINGRIRASRDQARAY